MILAAALAALLLVGCETTLPPPPASLSPAALPAPQLSVSAATCASPVPLLFTGRNAEIGYIGYRTCKGVVRNAGTAAASVDVWVDALDADGRPRGSCRRPLGEIAMGAEVAWETTCPVTAAEVGFAVRLSDPGGTPLPMRSP